MKEGPDIALIGSLIGDPARANMLIALMAGQALTATELAAEAGVTAQTASAHLSRLQAGGLINQRKQGRHRYFQLADDTVGSAIESMLVLAERQGHRRTRTGPKDPALRKARVCYDHLAGELAVRVFDSLNAQGFIIGNRMDNGAETLALSGEGDAFFRKAGIDIDSLEKRRRPVCKSCLDWSARRSHLAGSLGAALLQGFYDKGWAKREAGTRVVAFSRTGEKRLMEMFPV